MSRKSLKHQRTLGGVGTWKLIDEHTGFEISSKDVSIDEYGVVSHRDETDQPDARKTMQIAGPMLADKQTVPFTRPEPAITFVQNSDANYPDGVVSPGIGDGS
jgi:hypothetical protein